MNCVVPLEQKEQMDHINVGTSEVNQSASLITLLTLLIQVREALTYSR